MTDAAAAALTLVLDAVETQDATIEAVVRALDELEGTVEMIRAKVQELERRTRPGARSLV